jgi:TolB protein
MPSSRIRWVAAALLPVIVVVALIVVLGSDEGASPESKPSATEETPTEQPTARSEYSNIYVLDVGTRKIVRLTSNEDEQFADFPSWSKSGKLVYSESECEGCAARLFASDVTGSKRARIASDVTNTFQPVWSPDERRIVVSKPGSGIYVIDARDGSAKRLSRGESDEAPAWSPDGKQILFHRQVTATNWDIYEIEPGGGSLHRLTRDPGQQLHPAWSADGRKIAFAEQHSSGNWVIYSMNPDRSGRRQITDQQDSSQDPSWSPDGTRIAFVAQTGGQESVAVIGADGSGRVTLTSRILAVTAPSWSPNGRSIAFAAKHVGAHFAH